LLDNLSGFGDGWHAHLDVLERMLDGVAVDWEQRWEAMRRRYEEPVIS
jgi:hypothetical protein